MARSDGRAAGDPQPGMTRAERRTAGTLVLAAAVALAVVLLVVLRGAGGSTGRPDGGGPARALGRTLYVDGESRGGRCSDRRAVADVSRGRPWCSLHRAVAAAPAGATILVRGGRYEDLAVAGRTGKPLTVRAARGERPAIHGLNVIGSRDVRVEGFRITDIARVEDSIDVTVAGSDVSPHGFQVTGGRDLRFRDNHIHDLTIEFPRPADASRPRCHGLGGGGLAPRCGYAFRINSTSRVEVSGNRMEDIPADGIQMAGTADVRILRNRFERIRPFVDRVEHSDAIQMVGANARTEIVENVFVATRGVIAHPGPRTGQQWPGAPTRMVVEGNLFAHMDQWAARLYDVEGLRFERNTAWDAGTAGVELREHPGNPERMVGARFAGNILGRLTAHPSMIAGSRGNLIGEGPRSPQGDVTGQPRFRDPAALDYRLVPGSPFEGLGAPRTAAGTVPVA